MGLICAVYTYTASGHYRGFMVVSQSALVQHKEPLLPLLHAGGQMMSIKYTV